MIDLFKETIAVEQTADIKIECCHRYEDLFGDNSHEEYTTTKEKSKILLSEIISAGICPICGDKLRDPQGYISTHVWVI